MERDGGTRPALDETDSLSPDNEDKVQEVLVKGGLERAVGAESLYLFVCDNVLEEGFVCREQCYVYPVTIDSPRVGPFHFLLLSHMGSSWDSYHSYDKNRNQKIYPEVTGG
jgi:hypothetical protein